MFIPHVRRIFWLVLLVCGGEDNSFYCCKLECKCLSQINVMNLYTCASRIADSFKASENPPVNHSLCFYLSLLVLPESCLPFPEIKGMRQLGFYSSEKQGLMGFVIFSLPLSGRGNSWKSKSGQAKGQVGLTNFHQDRHSLHPSSLYFEKTVGSVS